MSKTFSQMNYRQCKSSAKIITMIITSNDSLWTSVTSHQAQAHPPTTVFLLVDPQQPPERNGLEKSFFSLDWCINLQIIRKGWTDNHEMCIGQRRIHVAQQEAKRLYSICLIGKTSAEKVVKLYERSLHFLLMNCAEKCLMHMASRMPAHHVASYWLLFSGLSVIFNKHMV